jgi:fatty acid desaturase
MGSGRPNLESGVRRRIASLRRTTWCVPVIFAAAIHAGIMAIALIFLFVPASGLWLPLAWATVAVAIRSLENLVHDAAHQNWHRPSRGVNDALANALAAWPTFQTVAVYRKGHLLHHQMFGRAADPCLHRMRLFGLDRLDRSTAFRFLRSVFRALPAYIANGLANVSSAAVARFAAWHGLVWGLALGWFVPVDRLLTAWSLVWAIPHGCMLPALRLMAESNEHVYDERNPTQWEGTVTNRGTFARLLHPLADGEHGLHHLFPQIPFYRLRRGAQLLAAAGNNVPRLRTSLLQTTKTEGS